MRDVSRESGDYIRGYSQGIEDARAAVGRVRAYYPEDVFPIVSDTRDGWAARMARLTCDNVLHELNGDDA